jgi:hypothetical protein
MAAWQQLMKASSLSIKTVGGEGGQVRATDQEPLQSSSNTVPQTTKNLTANLLSARPETSGDDVWGKEGGV